MTAKKYDYIIIYCFVFASILCIAVLARVFVVRELQMDEFSGLAALVVSCLLHSATYLSFQSFVNEWLQPVVERIFRKKHPHIESEKEVEPITETLQEEPTVPNYEEYCNMQYANDHFSEKLITHFICSSHISVLCYYYYY